MISLLVLASVALGVQDAPAERLLTLTLPAASVGRQVEALVRELGTDLKAAPTVAQEIVALRLDGARASEVMDRLASVLGAQWETVGTKRWLNRKPNQDAADADEAAAWVEPRMRAEIEERYRRSQQTKTFDKEVADRIVGDVMRKSAPGTTERATRLREFSDQVPSGRLAAFVLKNLKLSPIARQPIHAPHRRRDGNREAKRASYDIPNVQPQVEGRRS